VSVSGSGLTSDIAKSSRFVSSVAPFFVLTVGTSVGALMPMRMLRPSLVFVCVVVSAWTNPVLKRVPGVPVLKRVPGVAQVLAVACGLAYRLGEKMKAGRCFVGKSVLGCE
jgi:hypothetical protein